MKTVDCVVLSTEKLMLIKPFPQCKEAAIVMCLQLPLISYKSETCRKNSNKQIKKADSLQIGL